jgi:hypothetical protein
MESLTVHTHGIRMWRADLWNAEEVEKDVAALAATSVERMH